MEPEDFLEYDAGQLSNAVELAAMVENYVWPDYMVGVEGSWVVFRRDREKYFPRKKRLNRTRLMVKTKIKK